MRVAIITWWKVQFPFRAAKDLFALQMRDPSGGYLHPWKLAERLFNHLWITATSGRPKFQFLLSQTSPRCFALEVCLVVGYLHDRSYLVVVSGNK
jgi:hypothetical protein